MNPDAAGISAGSELIPFHKGEDRPRWQVWAIALAAGIVAGLGAWIVGELVHNAFKPQLFNIKIAFTTYIQPTTASLNAADFKNASIVFAVLGAVTGLVMGIAGGLAGRTPKRALVVGLVALVVGAVVGGAASLGLLPFFYRRAVPDPNDLLSPVLIHAGIWIAIGAVGALAFGTGMRCGRDSINALVGACVGALVATLLFHGLGEALFPDSAATAPLATLPTARLLADFLITLFVALGAAKGILSRSARVPKNSPPQLI